MTPETVQLASASVGSTGLSAKDAKGTDSPAMTGKPKRPYRKSKAYEKVIMSNLFTPNSATDFGTNPERYQFSEHPEIMEWSIGVLPLTHRAFNALTNADVRTIGDLTRVTPAHLRKLRGIGRNSADEISAALQLYGLSNQPIPQQLVTAIRFHLDGTVEVSSDYGETWKPFEGIVINAGLIEYQVELAHMRREQEAH
jgi:hypothetical protein